MIGTVGLTFVTVAVSLVFVIKSSGQGDTNRPVVEAVLPGDMDAPDAAPSEALSLAAGSGTASAKPPADAGPAPDASPADSEPDDAGPAEEVASAPSAPSKKASLPAKTKPRPQPKWRPRHR